MLRKSFKVIGWIVAGLVGLVVASYLVLLVINWRDRPPSQATARFERLYRERAAVADSDNAYVFMLGFGATPDEDVRQLGIKRLQWFRAANDQPVWDPSGDPLVKPHEYASSRVPEVRGFLEACRGGGAACLERLDADIEHRERWLSAEALLLERYRQLIAHSSWQEFVPRHAAAFALLYGSAMDGQELLLLSTKNLVDRKDYSGARKLLDDDVRFWRMVLASSDTLISKMIAVAALNRHFEVGNLVLRSVPQSHSAATIVPRWREPFSSAELSMERSLIGEWVFVAGFGRTILKPPSDATIVSRLEGRLTAPFYQPQDTSNRQADSFARLIAVLDSPLNRYTAAVEEARKQGLELTQKPGALTLYNPIGTWIHSIGSPDFSDYATRAADLEGVRRAVLAAATLRSDAVEGDDIAMRLPTSQFRNPYDDQPFDWDARDGSIVFRGLAPGERAEHRIRY